MKTYRINKLKFNELVDGIYNCYTPIGMFAIKRFARDRFLLLLSTSHEDFGYFNSFEDACDRATDYFIDELAEFVEEI